MNIGDVRLESNIFLAPMAGVTDKTFRIICRNMGAGLVTSEMISSKGLYYGDKNTDELTSIDPRERPTALQIFGSDPDIMASVVKEHINPRDDVDIIDINMGCPAPKIVKNGDGSALLKTPILIREILKKTVRASKKPVTLKIRMGWDAHNINGVEIAQIAEDEGISAITIHGRTRDMFYLGSADWDFIRKIKEHVTIPVIGNGDIFEPIDALNMLKETGCDAVAIGRGARGNPWIFKRIRLLMEGKDDVEPSYEDRINMAVEHLGLICHIKGEKTGAREMRKHIAWYIKGIKNSNEVKNRINVVNTRAEMENILHDYLVKLKNL